MRVKAMFISDVHIGSHGSNCDKLLSVLKEYKPEYLFIVGDFIDGWLLKKRHFWIENNSFIIYNEGNFNLKTYG
jgi:UDP-2,3-diacylglucosamine pyrophosphatase LpxH